jgi:sugar phosphate isomerase/epimerase
MKVAFCFDGDLFVTRPDIVRLVDELGYDGIEIWAQAFEKLGLSGVKAVTDSLNCQVTSVNPYFDFTTSEETYARSLDTAKTFIGYAVKLGSTMVRTFSSRMSGFTTSKDAGTLHWERAVRGIQEACDLGAPNGISMVLEVHHGDGQLFDSSDNALRILNDIDRENCILNLQTPLLDEDPMESANRLGPYVKHVHAHNWVGGWEKLTRLDQGDLDFERYLRILVAHGFDGTISIEHARSDPEGIARHEIAYLRGLISRIESKEPRTDPH